MVTVKALGVFVLSAALASCGSGLPAEVEVDPVEAFDAGPSPDGGGRDAGPLFVPVDAGPVVVVPGDGGLIDAGVRDGGSGQPIEVDVLVVGASAGGISAAIQASRMGRTVALLEETDHLGGQLLSVTSMDEVGSADRENGLYAEFAARIIAAYAPRPVGMCHWSTQSLCYEAGTGEEVLRKMLSERQAQGLAKFIVQTRTQVVSVQRTSDGHRVTGATTADGQVWLSKVLIDATEYGDVMPLAQVPYRVGNSAWDPENLRTPNLNGCVQNITSTMTIRFYDAGIPAQLNLRGSDAGSDYPAYWQILSPGYHPDQPDGGPCDNIVGWSWNCHAHYRGVPDRDNPLYAQLTKTMINAINDYPTILTLADSGYSIRAVEDRAFRKLEECRARRLTLQFLYYGQSWLGVDWAAADEVTRYGTAEACDEGIIPAAWRGNERLFPQTPYVRESRRLLGVRTIAASDILRVAAPGVAPGFTLVSQRRFATSLSVGYYTTDLHACWGNATLETDLETSDQGSSLGPFQVPFGTFIPRAMDGFLVAEKNLSQTRMVNGATRLQPICMDTGQAAGAIAAISTQRNLPLRDVPPVLVQRAMLDSNNAISVYGFTDVPRSHPRWGATQLVSTHGILAGYGNFLFGEADPLTRGQAAVVLQRTLRYPLPPARNPPTFFDVPSSNPVHRFVEAMFDQGLTSGCGGGQFCPGANTTRAQLAVFLIAGLKEPGNSCSAAPFPDVPASHFACPAIFKLKSLGLAVTCDAGFCPDAAATRGEAAQLAANALGYLAANPTVVGTCYRSPPDYCDP